jgi:hypothetical protein
MRITETQIDKLVRILFFIIGAAIAICIADKPVVNYFDPCSMFSSSYPISANWPWLNATNVAPLQNVLATVECSGWLANHPSPKFSEFILSWSEAFFTLITIGVGAGRVWVFIYNWLRKIKSWV